VLSRRLSALLFALLFAVALAAAAGACCDDQTTATTSTSSSGGGHGGAPAEVKLRIDPPSATANVTFGTPAPALPFHAYATVGAKPEVEITGDASWSISPALGTVSGGAVTLAGVGGKATLSATYEGATASAPITVHLTGEQFGPGTDATTKASFDAASPDPDAASAPAIEYPEDETVLPANLPPIEAQWSQASDNTLYRVTLSAPDVLDFTFYAAARELAFPADAWAAIRSSTPDVTMTLAIDGLGASGLYRRSAPRALTISADTIDQSAIYVWQSSSGSFRVLDIVAGTDVPLPNNAPDLGQGQPCSGCHRVSRDGKRFAYTYNGANFFFGALAFDPQSQSFVAKIAPSPAERGTYATFNPLEATTRPAMIVTIPDDVPQNTPGTVRISMFDPDTNAPVTSNIADMIAAIDPAVGHATSMPDWSPDGDFVVFAAYDSDANYVRLLGDDIVRASIVEAPVSYDAGSGSFTFGTPKTLVAAAPASDPDTGENNFLPSISPDGSAVAFTRAAGWWSLKTQQSPINLSGRIAVVRRSDGAVIELHRGSNGPGTTMSSTWPQWAPTIGSRYAWLAYASERPYGHRLTNASPENAQCNLVQGQKQCKQLWVMAIDKQKLASGTDDPSAAPFWIPGQNLAAQYVSPQWTKAVIVPQ
jgi:hypothetical protein